MRGEGGDKVVCHGGVREEGKGEEGGGLESSQVVTMLWSDESHLKRCHRKIGIFCKIDRALRFYRRSRAQLQTRWHTSAKET